MSGWTFDVTISKVTTKTKTVTVRAFSEDEAIEIANRGASSQPWTSAEQHIEYNAREVTYDPG